MVELFRVPNILLKLLLWDYPHFGYFLYKPSHVSDFLSTFLWLEKLFKHVSLLVQSACVRHPWWRTEAKLAIVFTYYYRPISVYWGTLVTVILHYLFVHIPVTEIYLSIYLSTFLFLFLLLRLLLFTHFGETPMAENLFPPIFWHN